MTNTQAFLIQSQTVGLRKFTNADELEFIALNQRSHATHRPWVNPPLTATEFAQYLARDQPDAFEGFALCRIDSTKIIGALNLSQISRGFFQSAYLGFQLGSEFEGQGYMTGGLRLLLQYAFVSLELHRLEANIQPSNARSVALVKRCGFIREGYSPKYLKINDEWQDHERWAIHRELWRPQAAGR